MLFSIFDGQAFQIGKSPSPTRVFHRRESIHRFASLDAMVDVMANGEENTPSFIYRFTQLYGIQDAMRTSIERKLLAGGYNCVADIISMPSSKARTQMFTGMKNGAYKGLKLMLSGNDVRETTLGMRFPDSLSLALTPCCVRLRLVVRLTGTSP